MGERFVPRYACEEAISSQSYLLPIPLHFLEAEQYLRMLSMQSCISFTRQVPKEVLATFKFIIKKL